MSVWKGKDAEALPVYHVSSAGHRGTSMKTLDPLFPKASLRAKCKVPFNRIEFSRCYLPFAPVIEIAGAELEERSMTLSFSVGLRKARACTCGTARGNACISQEHPPNPKNRFGDTCAQFWWLSVSTMHTRNFFEMHVRAGAGNTLVSMQFCFVAITTNMPII